MWHGKVFYGKCYLVVVWHSSTYTIVKVIKLLKNYLKGSGTIFVILIIYFYNYYKTTVVVSPEATSNFEKRGRDFRRKLEQRKATWDRSLPRRSFTRRPVWFRNVLEILETFAAICEKDSLGKSSHFESPPLVFPRNDVRATTVEIPYWWRVTTQIWVVLLIGWSKFQTNQKHSSDLSSERHQHGISTVDLRTSFSEETSCGVAKCRLLRSQAEEYDLL